MIGVRLPLGAQMIKHIIFDLGGVILNLNQDFTIRAFTRLGLDLAEINKQSDIFIRYETGSVSDNDFRITLNSYLPVPIADNLFDNAWNKMLLDLPRERFDILDNLRSSYNLYLLSNTNNIHITEFYAYLKNYHSGINFNVFFKKIYFSHVMGLRKPDKVCYQKVLTDNYLLPEETVFIDDSLLNIQGAASIGLKTILVNKPIDTTIYNLIETVL